MKKNETTVRTLETIKEEAYAKVDALNKETDAKKSEILEAEIDGLVKEYNDLSMLTAYSSAKAHELPIIELARICTYHKISKRSKGDYEVVDGLVKKVTVFSINESDTNLNVLKFIKWLKDRNFKMPADWQKNMSAAKANIIDQWKAFDACHDEHSFKIKPLKALLQTMVDDLGFIAGEKGNNALVVKSDHVKPILKYANKQTGVQLGSTLDGKVWDTLLLTLLNSLATGKVFENTYGSTEVYNDDDAEEAPAEDATPAKA